MQFPTLLATSGESQKRSEGDRDFKLEARIHEVFSVPLNYDFVDAVDSREERTKNRVLDYALRIYNYPETDSGIISSRGEVLKVFLVNSELTDFVLNATIPAQEHSNQWSRQLEKEINH